jgi:pimeloyl-ACP methyl ester carboxylesterase
MHSIEIGVLIATSTYHAIASYLESKGTRSSYRSIEIDGRNMTIAELGSGDVTILIDASLGGVEGPLLIDRLSEYGRVCIYDRAGYGDSQWQSSPRHSDRIVTDLDALLTAANIPSPYLLIGDSFGSYNLRLFADRYPDKTVGLILTDGLDPRAMLDLPLSMKILKLFFTLSFYFVAIGAALGMVRILGSIGIFEVIKPELKQFPKQRLNRVKKCFYSPLHWWTMAREMSNLNHSGRQLQTVTDLGSLPIVSIKSSTFLKPILGIFHLTAADRVRDRIHTDLLTLSTNCRQISADNSSHFVWVDRPDAIESAVKSILESIDRNL